MSATRWMYAAFGSPHVDGCSDFLQQERCYVCGDSCTSGQPVGEWMGGNYTDQMRAACPSSGVVCTACVMVTQRTFPVPGRPPKDGKSFGGNFRNYSHIFEKGWKSPAFGDDGTSMMHYANASKGQKPLIREFLAREHHGEWFCSIADSGQKHVVHFAPTNGPGRAGMIIFEERVFWWPGEAPVLNDMMEMLTAGCTKDELSSGNYRPSNWMEMRERIEAFEQKWSGDRGGDMFDLCVWLAQRDEEAAASRMETKKQNGKQKKETPRKPPSGNDSRSKGRLPGKGSKPDGPLDTAGEPVQSSGNAVRDNERVVQCSPKKAANPCSEQGQLGLFG